MKLRVTFLLPRTGGKPIGGFKVTYEYANYLASQGHAVSVVHPIIFRVDQPWMSFNFKAKLRAIQRYFELLFTKGYRPDAWFKSDPRVKMLWVPSLNARYIPDGDAVIATAWETAEWVPAYPASKGRKFYLIQHLETWGGLPERTMATWRAPLEKIVIAGWLKRHAEEMGEHADLIPNGLDFTSFRMTRPSESRDRNSILMLHHQLEWKGSADGLAAFAMAKNAIPELRLTLFGIFPRPDDLPEEIAYHHRPEQATINELYNEAAIFVGPSWLEGWGLPPAEALLCGAAIAVTETGADEAYAIHDVTALRSPVKDPAALAANIVRLVQDDALRLRLARAGQACIREFTWERAGKALEAILQKGQG